MGTRNEFDSGQRRREKTWLIDEKGREYCETGRGSEREYRSQEDRDSALEEKYHLPCTCCTSLLQAFCVHSERLVDEYMAWVREHKLPSATDPEMLHRWEVERFMARAYPSAHGLMAHQVWRSIYKRGDKPDIWENDQERRLVESVVSEYPKAPGEPAVQYIARIAVESGLVSSMDGPPRMPAGDVHWSGDKGVAL